MVNLFENIATKLLDPDFKFIYDELKTKEGEKKNIKIGTEENQENSNKKKKKKCC